jgi:hypothetical protein
MGGERFGEAPNAMENGGWEESLVACRTSARLERERLWGRRRLRGNVNRIVIGKGCADG